jgi:hypothetical protein
MDQNKIINLSNKQIIKKINNEIPGYKPVGFRDGNNKKDKS